MKMLLTSRQQQVWGEEQTEDYGLSYKPLEELDWLEMQMKMMAMMVSD